MTRNGTALTTIAGGSAGFVRVGDRAASAFTAQLLAMRHDSPDFRQRRRIEPALGVAAYRDSLGRAALASVAASTHA